MLFSVSLFLMDIVRSASWIVYPVWFTLFGICMVIVELFAGIKKTAGHSCTTQFLHYNSTTKEIKTCGIR